MTQAGTRRKSNYDLAPRVRVPDPGARVWKGAAALDELLAAARTAAPAQRTGPAVVVIDCYPGVDVAALVTAIGESAPHAAILDIEAAAGLDSGELAALLADELTDDRVFGRRTLRALDSFYDAGRLADVRRTIAGTGAGTELVIVGWGAAAVAPPGAVTVLADMPRWEIQQRFRRGGGNWRAGNGDQPDLAKFKRGYFVEWRVADEHKRALLGSADYLLDTTAGEAKLITGDVLRLGLRQASRQPFRVVPFFDPGPWGGTWMEETFGLPALDGKNYAWCFDCVPEENSLLLEVAGESFEIPSLDLVLSHPRELLGQQVFARFGAEFPIRFDFLDTVNGGNLSLQVHPLTDYIQRRFGMNYTQDESYYMLDAAPDAQVYLGLRDDVDPAQMVRELGAAQRGEDGFAAEKFVNVFPAKAHDHFLIPAGTVHASGRGGMVLEISATPYIFTFKLWDWGRLGLDGLPRPIHLDHGTRNIQWDRRHAWAQDQAVNNVVELARGPGWVEERTGLHELEFIETRRHWFSAAVDHDTRGTVNVLNLVAGDEAVVESPDGAFEPFTVHYAETFIVPAGVGRYRIRPTGTDTLHATIKASVRGTETGTGAQLAN